MKEITVIVENRIGTLANIAEALGGAGVNIEAISAYGQGTNAIFRMVTKDPTSAKKAMDRVPGVKEMSVADIVVVKMPNRPGELGKITRKLANRKVDLESVYILGKTNHDFTEVAVKPVEEHLQLAKDALGVKD
ncbi:MAG TPA: ACT domain-containing protein [Candidatus Bilamarchaeaceae archaeon]|nr:ACT domain-containing protein [Candidatus Bilamarchaeaceae archaeon]